MKKIGHYATEIIAAIIVLAVISIWVPFPMALRISLGVVLVTALIVAVVQMRQHNRGWCYPCHQPLQPETLAERHARPLRLVHIPQVYAFTYGMTLIAITVLVLAAPTTYTIIMWSILQLSMIYVLRANILHTRLQPWCPKCKNGGTKVDARDPFPVDGLTV